MRTRIHNYHRLSWGLLGNDQRELRTVESPMAAVAECCEKSPASPHRPFCASLWYIAESVAL